eukprot:CAMPEP_0167828192 /NCGR_PEP_ID=MMETSP0112_2-20121227/11230_1 /TAXON_ID=91324 /ORGANISM="Lotharella globosa, Strain CCCM811" /LENGTH=325 /DNA_ID=CAMNT_0007731273 /DNA_START=62 /DNA_END=1040 /DNA_ORIENTATION=-
MNNELTRIADAMIEEMEDRRRRDQLGDCWRAEQAVYRDRKRMARERHVAKISKKMRQVQLEKKENADRRAQEHAFACKQYYKWQDYHVRSMEDYRRQKEECERQRREKIQERWQRREYSRRRQEGIAKEHEMRKQELESMLLEKNTAAQKRLQKIAKTRKMDRIREIQKRAMLREGQAEAVKKREERAAKHEKELMEKIVKKEKVIMERDRIKTDYMKRINSQRKEERNLKNMLKKLREQAKYAKKPSQMRKIFEQVKLVRKRIETNALRSRASWPTDLSRARSRGMSSAGASSLAADEEAIRTSGLRGAGAKGGPSALRKGAHS